MGGKFIKRVGLVAATSLLVGGAAACYPGSISDIGEADLVLTAYDTTFDFGPLGSYFLIDSLIRVGDDDEEVDDSFDDDILAAVASEMEALGYVAADSTSGIAPDVVVAVGANSSTFGWWVPGGCWYCYYPGYPGWGPGWGYPGYPGYPWYGGGGYGGTYQTGSLAIVIANAGPVAGEDGVYWGAVINGLLSSSTANTAARVERLIGQAFDQSPYLATN
jgi:hypothetical protein